MFRYITYICKMLCAWLKYGKKICFMGIPKCDLKSKIKVVDGKIEIGKFFELKDNSYIAVVRNGSFKIGDNVYINRNCNIICQREISIGENTSIGPNVLIYDHDHCFGCDGIEEGFKTAPVIIEKNCWIGAGVIILRGTHIGEGSVIGAGTLLKGYIPAHSLVTSKDRSNLSIVSIS